MKKYVFSAVALCLSFLLISCNTPKLQIPKESETKASETEPPYEPSTILLYV